MSIQTIYNAFRSAGLSHAGALAMLGNADCESNCVPYRMQGDFSQGFEKSKAYTAEVDTGAKDPWGFEYDALGYGLFQWTCWSRKKGLYEKAKSMGVSIGDEKMQVSYAMDELQSGYGNLLSYLKTTNDIYNAVARVCKEYERPAINNVDARYQAAKRIEAQLEQGGVDPAPQPLFWPPRMIDKGMSGADVEVLQAVLKARGYAINYIGGKFDDLLTEELKKFQADHGLTADGVCGPLTWAKALERG